MTRNSALIVLLTLSLAFTLGLLYRQQRSGADPGPDYEAQVVRAREVAARLDAGEGAGGHGRGFVEIAARLEREVGVTGAVAVVLGEGNRRVFESLGAATVEGGETMNPSTADLLAAGTAVSDPLWRLPLHRGYREMLDSPIADINNTGSGGMAGSITAALFLAAFVEQTPSWAHLDMYAWNQKDRPGRPKGGEATALRALLAAIERRFAVP